MIKKQFPWLLGLILLLAGLMRFYQLGVVPHGMTWDEAAIGYNGYAVLTTRRDEWIHRLPISFMSFGDFKAPAAIYINGIFTYLFGMNLWAVRLPFTLASIAAILGLILLVKKLTNQTWGLVAGMFMTFSPWHIHYSRAGFESGMSLSFMIWSLYLLFVYLQDKNKKIWSLLFSIIIGVASIYTYHSSKLVLPLIMLVIISWYHQKFIKNIRNSLIGLFFGLGLMVPMVWDSVRGKGLERLGTTILDELSGWELISTIVRQFLEHLSPSFLIQGATTTLRHGDGSWGVLLPTTFVLVILGAFYGFRKKSKILHLGLALVLIGLIPAALGEEIPHSNRALLSLPGFIMMAVYGLDNLLNKIKKPILKKSVVGTLVLIHFLFFIAYISNYFTSFAAESAIDFKDGYLEAFSYVTPLEEGVDKIIFTSDYGQPYIYALFIRKTNPIWYQGGSLIKYEFKDEINVGDLSREKTIIVASNEDEIEPGWADHLVYGSNKEVMFKIYLPKDK